MSEIKNDNILRRLVFIKYLYSLGIEQSLKSEPLCYISILTFHDSIELFLQLASEYLNVGKSGIGFMEYFSQISDKIGGKDLNQKESIRRLNVARVSFKHHGNLPSKLDVDNFKISVSNFFIENTTIIFKLEFEEISLIDLLTIFKSTKENLVEATELILKNEFNNALEKIAISFEELKQYFGKNFPLDYSEESFYTSRTKNILEPYQYNFDHSILQAINDIDEKMYNHVNDLNEHMKSIENIVFLLAMKVPMKKYIKYYSIIPSIYQTLNGNYHFQTGSNYEKNLNAQNVKYCFDFVLESAITLQGMFENDN